MKKIFIGLIALIILITVSTEVEAKRRTKRGKANKVSQRQSANRYPSKAHNRDFLNSCTNSLPTIYNPSIGGSMEGGSSNRMGEKVNSMEQAAKNGRPVTVAMDRFGEFGAVCNNKDRRGNSKRCLMLVHLPGLDSMFPAYGKKFPNLPADSFIALVEDTGGAFSNKGTGKIDIPFSKGKFYRNNPFGKVNFEILQSGITNGKDYRKKDFSHLLPFLNDRSPKCSWDASRRTKSQPPTLGVASNGVN